MKTLWIVLLLFLLPTSVFGKTEQNKQSINEIGEKIAADRGINEGLEERLMKFYFNAQMAIEKGDTTLADYWFAKYMGTTVFNENTERNYSDLFPLFEKGDYMKHTSLLSRDYSDDFVDFFIRAPQQLWEEREPGFVHEIGQYEFVIAGESNDTYSISIVASPFLETWYILKHESLAVLPLTKGSEKPYILLEKHSNGKRAKLYPKKDLDIDGFLQYIWPIEFHDLDGDKIPEIWIRYNRTWATGFSQELIIYKIDNDEGIVLLKKFIGHAEGIARRLDNNKVEIAYSFTEKEGTGHLGFDKHHFETFEYKKGEFVKIGERTAPHILWSDEWMRYYFHDDYTEEQKEKDSGGE